MAGRLRVLVVDDSAFFIKRINEALAADARLEVVGCARDGIEAVEQARLLKPDAITMDIEMPKMNGIEAVRRIMANRPTPILMFSALTYEGAKATLEALDAGAVDFLPKQLNYVANDPRGCELCKRIVAISQRAPGGARPAELARPTPAPVKPEPVRPAAGNRAEQILLIGASTGGPIALQNILSLLPANFAVPTVVAIHMPANFTQAFADRLNGLCQIQVRQAADGDTPRAGSVLIAPGGMQLLLDGRPGQGRVQIRESASGQIFRPSVDVLFGSAARVYGNKALGLVLTGMGSDGLQGARLLKQAGSGLWSQDAASCVVYGMPQAVESAGLSDRVLPLKDIAKALTQRFA
ncbi:MAG: chemotaxis response regulator protein-glutamate methylesterase [Gammaproteobacteria bacterium SHHR-1]|uniref:protein-glutamate methylesterase/protein-glutamine glutaminase n=1 Tax=Magnetovirga frankeli TaxID=947516 RepID=UPI0012938911|nr:chemotaxis response regulator protein-glutamate methylesterase [gamma proteobacterium SS-5]